MDKRTDLFAATPPLEAKKMLFSMAVTEGIGYQSGNPEEGMKIDFIDISRAYFQADAIREVYVQLPEEVGDPCRVEARARIEVLVLGSGFPLH